MRVDAKSVARLISYNPEAGEFVWRESRRGGAKAGDVAGCIHPEGYISITVEMTPMKGSHVAWACMTGELPPRSAVISHRNGDRTDCRWSNIEIAKKSPSWDFKDMIDYDPDTGEFSWRYKFSPNGRPLVGSPGWVTNQGYVRVSTNGKEIQGHRLAYRMMIGDDVPKGMEIDHINGDRSDNRWQNLRVVSRTQNNMNAGLRADNKSGAKGVYYDKSRGLWAAEIKVSGKRHTLGRFSTLEEAKHAREMAEEELFGEFSYRKSRNE